MNWTAIGALGEILGAFGVIITLIYLARQIRQNTKASRLSTANAVAAAARDWNAPLLQDPELAWTFQVGTEDPTLLDEKEQARFVELCFSLLRMFEDMHYQYQTDPSFETSSTPMGHRKWLPGAPWLRGLRGVPRSRPSQTLIHRIAWLTDVPASPGRSSEAGETRKPCGAEVLEEAGDRSRARSASKAEGRRAHRRPSAWEAPRQSPDSYGIRRGYGRFHTISVGSRGVRYTDFRGSNPHRNPHTASCLPSVAICTELRLRKWRPWSAIP